MTKRILFYSHDTFGLGHIRRTQKLANALSKEGYSILIACSSPLAASYLSGSGIEYLNLPGFTKQSSGEYVPRSLDISVQEFTNLRSSILSAAVKSFAPDLVIVDKEPAGVRFELQESLEYLKTNLPNSRVVCGFRDILDNKEKVWQEWERKSTVEILDKYFDEILIYGQEDFFNFETEYSLPSSLREKLSYTGYLNAKENPEAIVHLPKFANDKKIVTLTLGGGGDGWFVIESYLRMLENEIHNGAFNTYILTGPFVTREQMQRLKIVESQRSDLFSFRFTSNTDSVFNSSDLVVSMGGYNTSCELFAKQKYPLIIPRVLPRTEQLIRARLFQSKKFCEYLHPEEVNEKNLCLKINAMLEQKQKGEIPEFRANGLDVFCDLVEGWFNERN